MSKNISIEELVKRIQNSKTLDEQNLEGISLLPPNSVEVDVPFSMDKFASLAIMEDVFKIMDISVEDGKTLFYDLYLKLAAVAKKYEIVFKYYHMAYLTSENLNQSFSGKASYFEADNIPKYAIYDDNPYRVKGVFLCPKDLTVNTVYARHTILHETAHACIPIAYPPTSFKKHEATWVKDILGKHVLQYEFIADLFSICVLKELFPPHKRDYRETIKRTYLANYYKEYLGEDFPLKAVLADTDGFMEILAQEIKKPQD